MSRDVKNPVLNRGVAPDSFLHEIVAWAKTAPDEIFAVNPNPADIYATVRGRLGPYESILQRKAVMLEVMRVHAGFESSWNWSEGVDTTNKTSMANLTGQETGIFQVSFDSVALGNSAMLPFVQQHDCPTPRPFIDKMKTDHSLALEYYARLVRVNVKWAGPIMRGEINQWLSRDAMAEFEGLIFAP